MTSMDMAHALRFSRYLLIEEIGRGGMGVVLRAYDPALRREVALKILRKDVLTRTARERLVREARSMARVSHPHVVQIYDVEWGDDDTLALVLEYVPGRTLRQWLADAPRSWNEVLEVLIAAGRGLAAAHAEGLVHRDFKPDNVLIGLDGRARVTDFGLVRELRPEESAPNAEPQSATPDRVDDIVTGAGSVVGTLVYLAPERLRGVQADANTDQFAYCVTLWESLFGSRPFNGRTVVELAVEMTSRRIEPPEDAPKIPGWLLDAVRRGLELEPQRRWPSMESLLETLSRRTTRQPRWRLLGVAAICTSLITMLAWPRARSSSDAPACPPAEVDLAELWNDQRAQSIALAFEATDIAYAADTWWRIQPRITAYVDELRSYQEQLCRGRDEGRRDEPRTARTCLDDRHEELAALLDVLEAVDATVVQNAAMAVASLSLVRTCMERETAHAFARSLEPATRVRVRELERDLFRASAARATGRYAEAEVLAQGVLDDAHRFGWRQLVADARLARGLAWDALARYEDAARELSEAFFEASSAGSDEIALEAASALVFLMGCSLARHDEGQQWDRLARTLIVRLDLEDDIAVATRLNAVGAMAWQRGEYAEAMWAHERALAIQEEVLGVEHPVVATSLNNLANAHRGLGALERASAAHERALAIREQAFGPEHPEVGMSLNNLGNLLAARGDDDRALQILRRALEVWERALGPDHPNVATSLANIGTLLARRDEYDAALRALERALAIREQSLGPDHPDLAASLHNIGGLHRIRGDEDEALHYFERALAVRTAGLGIDHPDTAISFQSMAAVHEERGELEAAAGAYAKALDIRERTEGTPLDLARTRFALARVLRRLGRESDRSLELALQARDAYVTLGEPARSRLDEVEAWLDARERHRTGGR